MSHGFTFTHTYTQRHRHTDKQRTCIGLAHLHHRTPPADTCRYASRTATPTLRDRTSFGTRRLVIGIFQGLQLLGPRRCGFPRGPPVVPASAARDGEAPRLETTMSLPTHQSDPNGHVQVSRSSPIFPIPSGTKITASKLRETAANSPKPPHPAVEHFHRPPHHPRCSSRNSAGGVTSSSKTTSTCPAVSSLANLDRSESRGFIARSRTSEILSLPISGMLRL